MPQMAPLNWLSLMMMFLLIFLLTNCFNYFIFEKSIKSNDSYFKKKETYWKW
uniref:ATP synthase complex subunit 8 n=1 Tax=Coleoptera sp. ACP-2013 TaxID=2485033 RepID=A0A3G3MEM0_9COLE|nr:ATP synthase F0 subunit 8 [Coleoptera sp. ACP-2013]